MTFETGFEKVAGKARKPASWIVKKLRAHKALPAAALGGYLGGMGTLLGHTLKVEDKVDAAKHGKEVDPEVLVQKHPKLSGALTLGIAPAVSAWMQSRKRNLDNPKVRDVMTEHPYITSDM